MEETPCSKQGDFILNILSQTENTENPAASEIVDEPSIMTQIRVKSI